MAKNPPPPGKRGLGKAQFLANKEEIKIALENGWNAKDIWNEMHSKKQISIQYRTFVSYVTELIKDKPKTINKVGSSTSQPKPTPIENKPVDGPTIIQANKKTSITFDAKSNADIDDSELF